MVNSRCYYRCPFLVGKRLFRYGRNIYREQSKNIDKIFKIVMLRIYRSKIQKALNLCYLSNNNKSTNLVLVLLLFCVLNGMRTRRVRRRGNNTATGGVNRQSLEHEGFVANGSEPSTQTESAEYPVTINSYVFWKGIN